MAMALKRCCLPYNTIPHLEAGVDGGVPGVVAQPTHFRFKDLPLEIRYMIYDLCFDFGSIDRYFKAYFDLKRAHQPFEHDTTKRRPSAPRVVLSTPSVLLLCKSITAEALPILHVTNLNLSYGILDKNLVDLICHHLIGKLRNITITDMGCRDVEIPPEGTFTGWCYTMIHLAGVMRHGHNLNSIHLSFKSAYIIGHLDKCLTSDRVCGIKTWVLNCRRSLMELRNIKKVTLDVKIPEDMKTDMINTMRTPATTILALPYKVRKMIYSYAANFNEATTAMLRDSDNAKDAFYKVVPKAERHLVDASIFAVAKPIKKIATILSLNKQIASEAGQIIFNKVLVIRAYTSPCPPPKLEDYVTLGLLTRIRSLYMHLESFPTLSLLDEVVNTLLHNPHHLLSLHIHFGELSVPVNKRAIDAGHFYPDRALADHLIPLCSIRGLQRVTFSGDLPRCFTKPLAHNMTAANVVVRRPMMAKNVFGQTINVEDLEPTLDRFGDVVDLTGVDTSEPIDITEITYNSNYDY